MSQAQTQFKTTAVFAWNYNSHARVKINQGGTSSGKTYAILQVIFLRLIQAKRIATVVGQDIPNLKKGALRDFQERVLVNEPWMTAYIETYNSTERVYRFKNGSILEFTSFKDDQDAKNGKREIAFFNEANGIGYGIYKQVAMRTSEEIFIDYNPSETFWVHEFVMPDTKAVTFYSNFTHNPYIEPEVREYILSLKDKDAEAWAVYGLGKTGAISEIIFQRFTSVPVMPSNLRQQGYGMDFGYTADPTTLVFCGVQNERDIYLDEIFYAYHLSTPQIDANLRQIRDGYKIWADSSEARLIDDLRALRHPVFAADKGPNSVEYGIKLLLDHNLFITETSLNLLNERKKYKRKVDRDGKILNEPIDAFNHCWDAIRYWAIMNLRKRKKGLTFVDMRD